MTGAPDPDGPSAADAGQLFEVLEDLEARAGALHHRERAEEVADRSRTAYAEVELASRLMASLGGDVSCEVRTLGRLRGRIDRVGDGWLLLEAERTLWCLPLGALLLVRGLTARSVPREAWSPADRLGLGAWLRRLADEQTQVSVLLEGGARREGVVLRVGTDFLELSDALTHREPTQTDVLALAAVVAIGSSA